VNILLWVLIALALVAITVAIIFAIRKIQFSRLPPEVQEGIHRAKDARTEYRREHTNYEDRVSSAERELHGLEDPKGRRLNSAGGVELYERWIDTPQGHGSLIGVRAKAEDDPYALATYPATAQQASIGKAADEPSTGKAYVVIEGPNVSGVAVIAGTAGETPTQKALMFSAEINNAAHAAEQAAPLLAGRIETARQQLDAAKKDDAMVKRARQAYAEAAALLPAQYRGKFRDASS
jgi:hypothetical protein